MTIWAFKGPSLNDYPAHELQKVSQFLTTSVRNGISRFGWSYMDDADLELLDPKLFIDMTVDERKCWDKANFLLNIEVGDWIVHINLPNYGDCIAAQVSGTYSFEQGDNEVSDYRHMIKINPATIVEFNRNDERVLPIISSRLRLIGRYWRISYHEDFLQTLANLKGGILGKPEEESVGIFYLKKDLSPLLKLITEKIQKNHPSSHLESLIAQVFRKIPGVIDVIENGKHKGWGTDNGADLIITYKSGLSIINLEKQEKIVVQVKSYVDQHWETDAVTQINDAIRKYNANSGMIITTAESTENLEKAIERLSEELAKPEIEGGINKEIPISLIAGEDVAKFVLKYGGDLLLS